VSAFRGTVYRAHEALVWAIAHNRLGCLLGGHDYRVLAHRERGDQIVERCHRCYKVRSQPRRGRHLAASPRRQDAAAPGLRDAEQPDEGLDPAGVEAEAVAALPADVPSTPLEADASSPRLDLSALETIVHIQEAGSGDLIVDTVHGERHRVSATKDRMSGLFVSTYESLAGVPWNGREILVWQPNTSYRPRAAATVDACLERALAEIEAGPSEQAQSEKSSRKAADSRR
jgi:hypothetical protein